MLGELVKAVLERALEAELTAHLGYGKGDRAGRGSGNSRNGVIAKHVQTGVGPVGLQVPRDRAGSFEPALVPKRSGRLSGGLDDMIISLYAHGMSVRDIVHHLRQVYGTDLSAESVSRITDAVLQEVRAWQDRPLDPVYAAAARRSRDGGHPRSHAPATPATATVVTGAAATSTASATVHAVSRTTSRAVRCAAISSRYWPITAAPRRAGPPGGPRAGRAGRLPRVARPAGRPRSTGRPRGHSAAPCRARRPVPSPRSGRAGRS